jgi:hypothetical protein
MRVGLLALFLAALSACGEGSRPLPPVSTTIQVLEVTDRNEDRLAETLAPVEEGPPGAFVEEGVLLVHPDVAEATDPEVLTDHGVVLEDPHVPLVRCRWVVLRVTWFAGRGRSGGVLRVHAGSGASIGIAVEGSDAVEEIVFDPAKEDEAFEDRVAAVRLAPGAGGRIEADPRTDGGLLLRALGKEWTLAAGAAATLGRSAREVRVVERPLLAASIEIEGEPLGDPGEVVIPGRDHGRVEFATEWSATWHGPLPWRTAGAPADEEDPLR